MKKNRPVEKPWTTRPISPTCEVLQNNGTIAGSFCGETASHAYKAWGGGWMALCRGHAVKHLNTDPGGNYYIPVGALIASGEKFEGAEDLE